MKKPYLLLVLLCLSVFGLKAQTTLNTPSYSTIVTGSGSTTTLGITFLVTNSNSYDIYITKVGYVNYSGSGTHEIWHSTTSLTGTANVSSTLGWVRDATRPAGGSTYSTTIDNNYWDQLCVMIPANTTYRFAVVVTSPITMGGYPPYTPVTSNGVTLDPNGYWGYSNNLNAHYTTIPSNAWLYWGSITFTTCAPVSGLNVANIGSNSADLSWAPSSGGTGYEYSLTTTPTPGATTATTGTTVSASSLTASTMYYLHVRKVCSGSDKSCWATTSFTTKPPCTKPVNFTVTSLTPNSADFTWDPVVTAINYDYVVDQQSGTPAATGATNTLNNTGTATTLLEGEKYYVHIRTNCDGQQTDWSLDSFTTPIPCRAPVVQTDYINATEAVAYWDEVRTATQYEYAVTKSSTPPRVGTKIEKKSILMSALLDGVQYYVHVRSHCESEGIVGISPWSTVGFKTFPLGVSNINDEGLGLEVYPNPAQNVLNLKLLGTVQNNATIILSDISGRMLKQMQLTQNEMTMDISGIAPGVYQLRYKDDVNSKTIKVVKE